jgi:hypothetical protein
MGISKATTTTEGKTMGNVRITDNGSAYMISVNGLIVTYKSTLGDAWRHIVWMHQVASQEFTVGENQLPVKEWIEHMKAVGFIE